MPRKPIFARTVRPLNRWKIDSLAGVNRQWSGSLAYPMKGWLGRVFFNEHLVQIDEEDFALTLDPVVNFQGGYDARYQGNATLFVNTRGFVLEGRIGQKVTFQTSYLENQARFPQYLTEFVNQQEVVPGQGYARDFNDGGFDFGMASGEVSLHPMSIFLTLGQGRNFFGEGYRSLFLSDAAFNYPFFALKPTSGNSSM
ncbi:MAG: hypothetical protein U5L96_08695 [Owenweeksia sp.]|nr:hypothetical protein [Owenweeksia sp.]